jgi:hypothetical protein
MDVTFPCLHTTKVQTASTTPRDRLVLEDVHIRRIMPKSGEYAKTGKATTSGPKGTASQRAVNSGSIKGRQTSAGQLASGGDATGGKSAGKKRKTPQAKGY